MGSVRDIKDEVFTANVVVFAGHGAWYQGTTVIPEKTTLTIYRFPPGKMGGSAAGLLDDEIGWSIDKGEFSTIYEKIKGTTELADFKLPWTYDPGDTVPNSILLPPNGLKLGKVGGEGIFIAAENKAFLLSKLLLDNTGKNCHWSACIQPITKKARWLPGTVDAITLSEKIQAAGFGDIK